MSLGCPGKWSIIIFSDYKVIEYILAVLPAFYPAKTANIVLDSEKKMLISSQTTKLISSRGM